MRNLSESDMISTPRCTIKPSTSGHKAEGGRLLSSSPRPMLFARKTYGFGLQERFPTGARAMVLGTESGFRRGQEPGGQRPSLLPASTRINQNFWACVVDMKGNGGLYFPANFKSSYARNKVKGKMKKLPACPMIIVKGYEVE